MSAILASPATAPTRDTTGGVMARRLRAATLWLLALFVFTIPSTSVVTTGTSAGTVSRLIGVLTVPVAAAAVVVGGRTRRLADTHLLMLALTVWAVASTFWTIDMRLTESLRATFAQLWLVVVLVWEFAPDPPRWRLLLWAYVLGCLVGSAQVLAALANGTAYGTGRYTGGSFNPGDLSQILLLGVPMAWYLGTIAASRAGRTVARAAVPLALLAVLLTASRTALLIVPVALAIIPLSADRGRRRVRPRTVVVAVALTMTLLSLIPDPTVQRLETIPAELAQGDLNGRSELWEAALETIHEHPVRGVGVGALPSAIEAQTQRLQGAHNTFLAITGDLGVIGLGLFLLALGAAFVDARGLPRRERVLALVVLAVVVCTLFPSHNQYEKATWLAVALAIGPAGWHASRMTRSRAAAVPPGP